jgi:hypothetical protein
MARKRHVAGGLGAHGSGGDVQRTAVTGSRIALLIAKHRNARHDGQQLAVESCFFAILPLFGSVKFRIVLQ